MPTRSFLLLHCRLRFAGPCLQVQGPLDAPTMVLAVVHTSFSPGTTWVSPLQYSAYSSPKRFLWLK